MKSKLVNINLSDSRHLIHPLVSPEHFGENKVKAIFLPVYGDAVIFKENSNKILEDVFKNVKYEILPINNFLHAVVDSYAISKGLPINILATHFFRIHFSVYSMTALVTRSRSFVWISKYTKKERRFKLFGFYRHDLQSHKAAGYVTKNIQKNAIKPRKAMNNQC